MTFNLSSKKEENLCSIFHARFNHLRKIIPNTRQAQLMDYLLLGWQTSTYKLKNSTNKWFMKEFSKIVEDTGIALSTLKRYLKDFEEKGLIERRQALYSRTTESGFDCKKGCYITITSKLIFLLNNQKTPKQNSTSTDQPVKIQNNNTEQTIECQKNESSETIIRHDDSKNFNQNETFKKLNLRRLYICDLFNYENNNIRYSYFLKNVNKSEYSRLESYLKAFEKTLFIQIKEEIPEEIKKLVFATLANLTVQNKILLSSPEQIAAEYLFALINVDYFMKKVKCMKHRNNILAKLLRKKQWQTPKGFYNHFYLGQNFKDKNELREKHWEDTKHNEIKSISVSFGPGILPNGERHPKLAEVDSKMDLTYELISDLENKLIHLNEDVLIQETKNKLEELKKELCKLWDDQAKIEKEVEFDCNFEPILLNDNVA